MTQSRYITTLMRRLNKADPEETKFDYGSSDRGLAIKEQISDALTFWRFYENLSENMADIKNLPEDIDVLRHELLERIAAEDSFRGFIACWLRLPVTVVETLKWSQNLDIQSRESFMRRLERPQLKAVREAYDEFFVHRVAPTCLKDGLFRRLVHRQVTYSSLKAEPLISRNRVTGKLAMGKDYAHMGFGHSKYPQGAGEDTADSGTFRKFLSVKNHLNDFSVNQHDGLYWFLYRTLRSNYIWNRHGDVDLHPMICPGFWFTILGWFFFAIFSPFLALTVTFPTFVGVGPESSFFTFVGFVLGLVTPFLLLLYSVFYLWRDTRIIVGLGQAIDNHLERRVEVWIGVFKVIWFSLVTLVFAFFGLLLFADENIPNVYGAIPILLIGAYWYFCAKDKTVGPSLSDNAQAVLGIALVSLLIVAGPFWWEIISTVGLILVGIVSMVMLFGFQLLLFGALVGAGIAVGFYTDRVKSFQTARSGVTTERVGNEYRLFNAVVAGVTIFYSGVAIWAGYTLLGSDGLTWALLYPVVLLAVMLFLGWYILTDAYEVKRADPHLVVKRNAYINALREAGEGDSPFLRLLMGNDWIINHKDPVRVARDTESFVKMLTGFLSESGGLQMSAISVIDAGTEKRFGEYTHDVVISAYHQLERQSYAEYVFRAYEGYTPDQALQKAIKLKEQIEGKRNFWYESFPVRMIDKFVGFFEAIWFGIGKVFKDLFGMWHLLHKYCPAVAETKEI